MMTDIKYKNDHPDWNQEINLPISVSNSFDTNGISPVEIIKADVKE